MPEKRQVLIDNVATLVDSAAALRSQLQTYEKTANKIAKQLESGQPAVKAAQTANLASQRRQVTEGIQEFEAARHQLRLALFALGREEGASISDLGRVLGVSRQLASRLAAEAAKDDHDPRPPAT